MHPEQVSHMVAASVMPVVVISAAALLCLAFYNRLAAVITRLRAVQRERLDMQERIEKLTPADHEKHSSLRYTCILESLSDQSTGIINRARLIRATLACLLLCIACLVVCSLLNGLTVIWPSAVVGAVAFFAIGMLLLLGGVTCALLELKSSLSPAELEIGVVSELTGFSTKSAAAHHASGELRIA
jgi:Flp pilus assembly protein TadB